MATTCTSSTAGTTLLGHAPIFPVSTAGMHLTTTAQTLCVLSGLTGGLLAAGATWLVYRAEDAFGKLPFHWMWWPAIGGAVIGVGGLVQPRALGVGYDVIDALLTDRASLSLILGILTVKTLMWSLSLGSGTSGGVLAPVFMIGAALGALEGHLLPAVFPGFWAMMGLAAVVGGIMRSPLTGVVFTLELTHAWGTMLPLVIAATSAYAVSALILSRSVLTEKIARRGLHLTREYSTDPLEAFFARDVMSTAPVTLTADDTLTRARATIAAGERRQHLYPVIGAGGRLLGVISHTTLREAAAAPAGQARTVGDLMRDTPITVYEDDTLRHIAYLFAEHGLVQAPVVAHSGEPRLLGMITARDLLKARLYDLTEEHHRERHLGRRRSRPHGGPRRDVVRHESVPERETS
jgi:CBS domain-containing protein